MEPETFKAEAARREQMKPDIVKLREYAASLRSVQIPHCHEDDVQDAVASFAGSVHQLCDRYEDWCDEQEAGA